MISFSQYRRYSVWAVISMVIALVLSFAALWNTLLSGAAKHEGWVVVFIILLFAAGMLLFYIAYKTSDAEYLEMEIKNAYESGKTDILKEIEKKRSLEDNAAQKAEQEDIDNTVTRIMSGIKKIRDSKTSQKLLANLAKNMGFVQGILYIKDPEGDSYSTDGEFALTGPKPAGFKKGEGLPGQVAESKSTIVLYDIPEKYFSIASGLGKSKPGFLMVVPVLFENECCGVIELAAFKKPDDITGKILQKVSAEYGIIVHTSFAA